MQTLSEIYQLIGGVLFLAFAFNFTKAIYLLTFKTK